MTVEQLVEEFTRIALRQDDALLDGNVSWNTRLFHQMEAVEDELKSRPGDQRNALLALYDHQNAQVRLKAAEYTVEVAPEKAIAKLQEISDSQEYPQAGHAGMSLNAISGKYTS